MAGRSYWQGATKEPIKSPVTANCGRCGGRVVVADRRRYASDRPSYSDADRFFAWCDECGAPDGDTLTADSPATAIESLSRWCTRNNDK